MKKKTLKIIISLAMALSLFSFEVIAEDFSDTEYWDNVCADPPKDQRSACLEYTEYKINLIKNDIESAKESLAEAQQLANDYRKKIDTLQIEIDDLTAEIDSLNVKIESLKVNIAENETKVDELNQVVLDRMASKQSIMHFNPFLEFLLGAENFDDMLRRSYGLNAIMGSDEETRDEINAIIDMLNNDKAELETTKSEVDSKLQIQQSKQDEFKVLEEFYNDVAEQSADQIAQLQNEQDTVFNLRDEIWESINSVEDLPSSGGLIPPVSGAWISQGMPYYSSGGYHLGVDYAVSMGTDIVAPANGIIINTANGCSSWGGLGNTCGGQYGGVSGGGNQFTMIMAADGVVYGLTIFHLQLNSLTVAPGDIVMQGQVLGKVGSSGSSTGPHAHVELYLLGPGSMSDLDDYLSRGYSLSFNCGWGWAGLERLCADGVGAPCRIDGRVFWS